jgi:hypothetical protein
VSFRRAGSSTCKRSKTRSPTREPAPCPDCTASGQKCDDHACDLQLIAAYEQTAIAAIVDRPAADGGGRVGGAAGGWGAAVGADDGGDGAGG